MPSSAHYHTGERNTVALVRGISLVIRGLEVVKYASYLPIDGAREISGDLEAEGGEYVPHSSLDW